MKIEIKRVISFILCILLTINSFHAVSFASEDRTLIKRVSVTVTSDTEVGSGENTVDATVPNNVGYQIDEAVFSGKATGFKPGDKPKVKITISANDGYYFTAITGSSIFSIKGATYTSAKRMDNNSKLEIIVTLREVEGSFGEVPSATWTDGGAGKAKWERAEYASAYELRLYKGTSQVKKIDKVTSTTFDFKSYMTDPGTYYYYVRAIPKDDNENSFTEVTEWTQSDECYITQEDADKNESASGGSKNEGANKPAAGNPGTQNQTGWIMDGDRWWYKNTDGSYPKNDWFKVLDKWYLFDPSGYMITGWRLRDNKYYYLSSNGEMVTGWIQDDRKWYYLGPSGDMMSNCWIQDKGNWYCLDAQGVMLTGWVQSANNKWYFLNPADGGMVMNATVDGYYLDSNGIWIK